MATITFLEPGSDATQDASLYDAGGTGVTSTAQAYTGPRSLFLNNAFLIKSGILAQAGRRISFRVRFVDPTTAHGLTTFLILRESNGTTVLNLAATATGAFTLNNPGQAALGTGPVLSANTWYRVVFSYTFTSSTVNEVRVWFLTGENTGTGAADISVTNFTANGGAISVVNLVWNNAGGGAGNGYYIDDVYVDDGTTLDDPGAIHVTAKRPASNNVNNFDTAVGANPANRWNNVNEQPLSETNGWENTTATANRENYGIEAAAAGDVDVSAQSIVGYGGWLWAKSSVAASGTPKITLNGVDAAVSLATSSAPYMSFATSSSYPSNAATIGMLASGTAVNTFLYECGVLIAYTVPGLTTAQEFPAVEQFAASGGMVGRVYR